MSWFERNRLVLCRLCLVIWVAAFAIAAVQGCVGDTRPAASSVWPVSKVFQHENGLHHEACAQLCNATNTAVPQADALSAEQPALVLLLILPLFLLPLVGDADRTWRALFWPPSPKQPVRLRFVRFND